MKQLSYFMIGVITALLILPLSDGILDLLYLWIEALKEKPKKKILEGCKDTIILREFIKPQVQYVDDDIDDEE